MLESMATTRFGQSLNLVGVLSESKRIISAHSWHFLALSVFFLLPLAFSLIIFPTLQTTLSHQSKPNHINFLLRRAVVGSFPSILFPLLYLLFAAVLSLSAVATITYSTFHGFYGRPVKLAAALKSMINSFLPLLLTAFASLIVELLVCSAFGLFLGLVAKGLELLGFHNVLDSKYFIIFCVVVSVALVLVLVYLHVNWALAPVVAVVESKWGFEPLRRSSYLVKGMRRVSFYLLLLFGVLIGSSVWINSTPSSGSFEDVWKCLNFVLQSVAGSSFLILLMLYNVAANTVLYMYCKALNGELAWEIAEEFAREYVSLPFDDAKVPHVVFVAQA